MECSERKESKRDRVRRVLIQPLLTAGMRKQTRMAQSDYDDMLIRLADKLSYLSDENLAALVPLCTRWAKGKERNQWPDEVSVTSWAYGLQSPPPRDCPFVVSVMRSAAGQRAVELGYHAELFMAARKYGPPFSKLRIDGMVEKAKENRREVARVQDMIRRGVAPIERAQWLDWYQRHEQEALAIINEARQEMAQ